MATTPAHEIVSQPNEESSPVLPPVIPRLNINMIEHPEPPTHRTTYTYTSNVPMVPAPDVIGTHRTIPQEAAPPPEAQNIVTVTGHPSTDGWARLIWSVLALLCVGLVIILLVGTGFIALVSELMYYFLPFLNVLVTIGCASVFATFMVVVIYQLVTTPPLKMKTSWDWTRGIVGFFVLLTGISFLYTYLRKGIVWSPTTQTFPYTMPSVADADYQQYKQYMTPPP